MRLLLSGGCGKMGRAVAAAAKGDEVFGVDRECAPLPFPLFTGFEGVPRCDVLIDFSSPAGTEAALFWAREHGIPAVIGTTGLGERVHALLQEVAEKLPVFYSENFSLGIALMRELVRRAAAVLGYDAEIIERHHAAKKDAPSGTALSLFSDIDEARSHTARAVCCRHGTHQLREREDVGIHSVRGGTVVGEHEVSFYGGEEILTLSHRALSRAAFAEGAVAAAHWTVTKPAGLYSMRNLMTAF